MPAFKKGTIQLMATYLENKNTDKAIKLLKQARDSNYLNEQNITALYSYYPDLKKIMDEEGLKQRR